MQNPFAAIYREITSRTMQEKIESPRQFPILLDIELTNQCNFHCKMCPTGIGKMKRPVGYMSPETYMKILGEAQFYGAALIFIGWG